MGVQREQENRREVLHKLSGHKILKKVCADDTEAHARVLGL
jgi:hypothetical protein